MPVERTNADKARGRSGMSFLRNGAKRKINKNKGGERITEKRRMAEMEEKREAWQRLSFLKRGRSQLLL